MISRKIRVCVSLAALSSGFLGAYAASAQTADTTPPTLTSVTMSTSASVSLKSLVFAGDEIKLLITASEPLQTPVVTINGRSATVSSAQSQNNQGGDKHDDRNNRNRSAARTRWTAALFLTANEQELPITFSISATDIAGNAAAPHTTLTSGTVPAFMKTPSPSYCLWDRNFSQTSLEYNSGGYHRIWVRDALCPPTAIIATFSASFGAVGAQNTFTVTAKSNDKISTRKSCGLFGFNCKRKISVRTGTATSSTGALPAFVRPGEPLTLSWQCQPYQSMLWLGGDYSWWGIGGGSTSNDIKRYFFEYSTTPTGTGFSTGGKYKGTVTVNPSDTTKYKINCGSTGYQFPEIEVLVDNPQGTITASPASVRPGATATVFWSATSVKDNSCTVHDNTGRVVGTAGTNAGPKAGVRSAALTADMSPVTFTLTCERYSGEQIVWTSNPVQVGITCTSAFNRNNLQQCSFNSTSPVLEGGDTRLRWYCPTSNQSYRIDSSTDGGTNWTAVTSGAVPSGNNQERTHTLSNGNGPLSDTNYRLTCVSTGGNAIGSAQTIVSHPDLTIEADPPALDLGLLTLSRITWSASNVNNNSCTMTGDGLTAGVRGNNNSRGVSVTPASLPASYTLTCETPASVASRTDDPTETLTINMVGLEPTISRAWVEPTQVRKGEAAILRWEGENMPPSCNISYNPAIPSANQSANSTPTGNTSGVEVRPVNQRTDITVTCGTASATVTAGIIPEFIEI